MDDRNNPYQSGSSSNPGNPYRPSTPTSSSTPSSNPNAPRPTTPSPSSTPGGVPNSPYSTKPPNYNNPIDVTKPKTNYDRKKRGDVVDEVEYVPTDEEREKAALERLRNRAAGAPAGPTSKPAKVKGENSKKIKSIIAILLVLVVIALLIVFILFLNKNKGVQEEFYDIRVSMKIENKSALSIVTETGQEVLKEIHPGDKLPLKAYARNSEDYRGDALGNLDTTPPTTYVRFKLVLILGYEERNDILSPNIGEMWYRYNHEDEATITNGVQFDDGYYYYKGTLAFQQRVELFSELEFVGENITCDDGGKYGQIQVIVESVEATPDNIIKGVVWPTAPKYWVIDVTN